MMFSYRVFNPYIYFGINLWYNVNEKLLSLLNNDEVLYTGLFSILYFRPSILKCLEFIQTKFVNKDNLRCRIWPVLNLPNDKSFNTVQNLESLERVDHWESCIFTSMMAEINMSIDDQKTSPRSGFSRGLLMDGYGVFILETPGVIKEWCY